MNKLQLRLWTLLNKITGGRPMICLGTLFTDVVSGRPVRHYMDGFGRHWMAEGPWDSFRVERSTTEAELVELQSR